MWALRRGQPAGREPRRGPPGADRCVLVYGMQVVCRALPDWCDWGLAEGPSGRGGPRQAAGRARAGDGPDDAASAQLVAGRASCGAVAPPARPPLAPRAGHRARPAMDELYLPGRLWRRRRNLAGGLALWRWFAMPIDKSRSRGWGFPAEAPVSSPGSVLLCPPCGQKLTAVEVLIPSTIRRRAEPDVRRTCFGLETRVERSGLRQRPWKGGPLGTGQKKRRIRCLEVMERVGWELGR